MGFESLIVPVLIGAVLLLAGETYVWYIEVKRMKRIMNKLYQISDNHDHRIDLLHKMVTKMHEVLNIHEARLQPRHVRRRRERGGADDN